MNLCVEDIIQNTMRITVIIINLKHILVLKWRDGRMSTWMEQRGGRGEEGEQAVGRKKSQEDFLS